MSSPTMDTKLCALCGRGEKSLMGQGDLIRFEPTPGFNPFRKTSNRTNSRRSTDAEDTKKGNTLGPTANFRRARVSSKGKESSRNSSQLSVELDETNEAHRSQSQADGECSALPTLDELSLVGYPEEVDGNDIFEKSGHVTAHHCCAAWSDGVVQKEDLGLCNVDKAVFAGLSQKCSYCLKYGASIKCKIQNCSNKYHYPCASGGGCFQDIKTLSLLCPDHADQAINIANQEACCVVCDEPGCISDQLFCTSCGQHYHGNCLDPTVEVNPVVRAGWQCPECKICQTCRQPGDDNKMLVCDTCDKGYHTFCLRPVMSTIPKNGWKCKNCRVCGDCGSRTPGNGPSSRWHLNYSVCDSCYQQRNKGLCCPVCGKAYRHFAAQNKMLLCRSCKRHIHAECDESYEAEKKGTSDDYVCVVCKSRDTPVLGATSSSESIVGLTEENKLQDIENFGIFKVLKESKLNEGNCKEGKCEESCKTQESHALRESSESSSDLDLKVLEKNLSNDFGVMDDQSSSKQMIKSSDSKIASTPLSSSSSTRGSALTPALNQGKPQFNQEQYGKKIGARNKSRSVGVGKKKRPTHASDRKRGPKPKIKQSGANQIPREDQNNKDEEHTSTLVICSAKDQFSLKQDMCLSCGSFGKGEEGKLIACVQCGQCYHPYCVSIKVSPSMLEKGWRCLDCTVCEGCGKPHDESRLILCDECDISFHIYCLDPPLEEVPQGSWKCKWCIVCLVCGDRSPGTNCHWQDNYSKCGPCASLERCPVCNVAYNDLDLIIQCGHCERWIHGNCDAIKNEDDAESAIEAVYHCPLCRPITGQSGPVIPVASPEKFESPSKPPSPILVPSRELDLPRTAPKTYFIDGICLSEAGLAFIRKQSMRLGEKKRNPSRWKRTHPGLVNMHLAGMSSERSEEDIDGLDSKTMNNADLEDCKMEGGQEDDLMSPVFGDRAGDGSSVALEEKKKRPRMRMGMGVGGFIPRSRTRGGGTNKSRVLSGLLPGRLPSGSLEMGLTGTDVEDPGNMDGKKIKQRRPRKLPKRSHLEDAYPSYLQDAFFGRDLLDQYKPQTRPEDIDLASDEPLPSFARSSSFDNDPQLSKGRPQVEQNLHPKQNPSTRQMCEQTPQPGWMGDQQTCPQPQQTGDSSHQQQVPLDSLDVDSLDKDQAMDSLDQLEVDDIIDKFANSSEQDVLAQIDNETLEDILKNGLNGDPQQESDENFGMRQSSSFTPSKASSTSVSPLSPSADLPGSLFSHGETSTMWSQQPLRGNIPPSHHHHQQQQQHFSSEQQHNQAGMFVPHPNTQTLDQQHHHQQQQQIVQQQSHEPEEEEETTMEMTSSDNLTCNQRNIKKWQSDEMLGDSATISQVLYANMCHPELKQQYPEWSERVKQIAKLWRKVPTENRGPYLAKARANRAIYRSQNSQKESKKKQSKSETNIHQPDQAAPTPQPQDIQNTISGVTRDTSDPYSVPPATPQTSRSPSAGGFLHPSSQGMNVPPTTSMSAALFKQPHPKTPVMQQHYEPYQASRPPSRDYHVLHQHQSTPMEHFPGSNTPSNEVSPGHFTKHPFASPSPVLHLERSASVDVMKQYQSPRHSQEGSYQGGDPMSQMGHSASPGANMISPQQSPKIGRSMAASGYQRSISDPYGGIRPPSDPYSQPPSTPRPEPYGQMYAPHARADHYAQPPGTPRPDQFNQPLHAGDVHALRSSADPFAHHPRANVDPYAQMPMTPRPVMPNDPYIQAPMTPRPNMGEFNQQMIGSVRQGTSPLHHININHTRMMQQQQQNMMLQQGHNAAAMQGSDQFQNQSRLLRPSGPCPGDGSAFMGPQQRMPGYDHVLQTRYPSVNPHHVMNKEVYHQMSAGGQKPVMPGEMFVRASGMAPVRGPVGDFGGRSRPGFEANYAVHQKFPGSTDMYVAQQQARLPHDISMPMRYPMSKMPQQMNMEVQQHEQEQAFLQQQQHFQQLHQAQLLQKQQASCGQHSSQDPTNQNQGGSPGTSTTDHHPVADPPLENEPHTSSIQDSEETEITAPTSESDAKPEKSKQLRDLLAKQSGQKQKQKKLEEGSSTDTSATPSADGTPTSTSPPSTTAVNQAGQAPGSSTPLKHWPVDANYDAAQQQGMRTSNVGVTPLPQQQLHHMQAQHQQGIGMHQQDFSLRWPDQQAMLRLSHPSGMPQGSIINQQMDQSMVTFQPQQNCLMTENQSGQRFLMRPMPFPSSFPSSSNLQFSDDPNSYQQYPANPGIDPRHQQMTEKQHSIQLQQQQQAGMRMMLRQGFMQQHQQLHPRMFQQVSSSDGSWKLGFTFQQQPQHLQQNQQHMHQVQQQMQQQFFKTPANMMSTSMASPSPSGHQSVEQSMTPSNFGMHHQITSLQHLLNQNQAVPSSQSGPSSAPSVPSSMLLGGDSPSKMVEGNTDDQIEDLLGSADDGFNLLEYADDDLECNDKTIFDEHLGLIPPPTNSGNVMTSSNQSSVPTQPSAPTNEPQTSSSALLHSLDTSSERCPAETSKSNDSQSKSLAFNKQKGHSPAAGEVSSPPVVSSTNEVASIKGSPLIQQKSIHSQEDTSQQSQGSSQDVIEEMEGIEESTSKQTLTSRKEESSARVGKRSPKGESMDCQLDGIDDGLEQFVFHPFHTTVKKAKHSNSIIKAAIAPSSLQFDKDDMEVAKLLFGVKMGSSPNVGISLSPICQLDGAADDEDKPSTEQGAVGKAPISSAINETVDNVTSNSSEVSSVVLSDGKTPENCREDGVTPKSTNGNISTNNNYPSQDMSCSLSSSVQSNLPVSLMSSTETISLLPIHATQQLHAQPQTMLQLQQHVQALQQRRMLPQQQHNLDPRIMQQQHLMMMARAQLGLQQTAMDQLNSRHDSKSQEDILAQFRLQQQQLLHMQQTRQATPDSSLQRFSVAPPPYQAPRAARARLQASQLIPSSLYPIPRQQKWDMFQMGGQQQQLLQQQLQQQIFMQQQLQQQFPMNSMHLNQIQKAQDHNSSASTLTSADTSLPAPDVCLPTSGSQGIDKIANIQESQAMDSAARQGQFETNKNISALDAKTTLVLTSAQSILSTAPNISNESTFATILASTSPNVDLNVLSSVSTSMVNALLAQQLQTRPQGLVCMRTGMPMTELRHQPPIKDTQQRLNLPSHLMGQPNISLPGRPYLAPGSLVAPRMMPISSGLCMPRIARPLTQFNPMSAAAYQQQFSQGGRVITSLINMPGQLPSQSILSPKFFETPEGQIGQRPPSKPHGEQPLLLEDLLEEAKQEQRRKQAEQQQSSSADAMNTQATPASTVPIQTPSHLSLLNDADFEKGKADNPNLQDSDQQAALNRSHLLAQQQQHQGIHAQQDPDLNWQGGTPMDNMNPSAIGGPAFAVRPPNLALPVRMTSPFVMSPQAFFDPSSLQMPGSGPVPDVLIPPPPQRPPDPPSDCSTEEDKLVQKKYEEWLVHNEQWLTIQVQSFSDQVAKFRKTKKALTAKQRVARKNGNELNEGDAQNLEETSKEQSRLQKQLDQLRKQHRTHKTTIQEYKAKHQPITSMLPPPPQDDQQSAPSTSDQTLRAPASTPTARLPPAARQEYDQYVQGRLKQMHPQGTLAAVRTTLLQGDDNNPFSESYQQREKLRMQAEQQRNMGSLENLGSSQNTDSIQFPGGGSDQQFPVGMGPSPQPPGMRAPFINYPQQQAPVNSLQFVGSTGMKYPVFPNVDSSGITQQHGSLPTDTFQTVGLRLLTPGVSSEVPAFHSAQQSSLESEPTNLDEKPKRKRKHRKSILEKDETMPLLRSSLHSDMEKSHFISAGTINRAPLQPDNNMDQQMMMMMMMKNNFPPNVMQPTDACANAPPDAQQRLLQQVQNQTRINQFQSPTLFATDSSTIDDTTNKMVSVQDAILRKLLDSNKLNAPNNSSAPVSSSKMSEDEEEPVSLTPEQQRTLAMIESMPLTIETNKDESSKKPLGGKDSEAMVGLSAGDAQLQQLIKANSKSRHRRSPKQDLSLVPGSIPMQAVEAPGTKKRQKKSTQQMFTPQQMNQQQLLHQQIMQQQLFQQQQQQLQHSQHLLRQLDRPGNPPVDAKTRIDQANLVEQLIRTLQLQPPVLLKEPDVTINSNQFLHPNLRPGPQGNNADVQLCGLFGSLHSVGIPTLDYYSVQRFVPPLWLNKPVVSSESRDSEANRSAFGHGGSSTVSSSSHGTPVEDITPQVITIIPTATSPVATTTPAPSTTTCSTSSKLQMVTSILNKNVQPITAKLPLPPLIEPHHDSNDSSPMSMVSSSSPEPSTDDHPETLAFVSTNDLLLLPDLKVPPKEIVQAEAIQCTPACQDQEASHLMEVVEVKRELQQEEMSVESAAKIEVEVKPPLAPDVRDDLHTCTESSQRSPKSADHVSVMLTLSVSSAENINGVIAAIANLLKIAVPPTYEITRSPSPNSDTSKMPWISNSRHRETAVNIQSLMRTKTHFCKNCDAIIIGPGVRKPKSDLFLQAPEGGNETDKDDFTFCGTACCLHFSSTCRDLALGNAMKDKLLKTFASSLPTSSSPLTSQVEMKHSLAGVYDAKLSVIYSSTSIIPSTSSSAFSVVQPKLEGFDDYPMETSTAHPGSYRGQGTVTPISSSSSSPIISAADYGSKLSQARKFGMRVLKHKAGGDATGGLFKNKRMKYDSRIQRWKNFLVKSEKVQKLSSEKEITEIMEKQSSIIRVKAKLPDGRSCILCKSSGDADTNGPGRLLLLNADKWVHLNCALWSYEVYETMNGALVNVDHACRRGMPKKCVVCNALGATITCFQPRCSNQYHLDCAIKDKAVFYQDKTIICHQHANRADTSNILSSLSVFRRVYVNRDEDKQVAKMMQHEDRKCMLRVGSLIVHNMGQLLLHQIQSGAFNNHDYIFPVGYKSSRFYWSYRQVNKRCRYICKIEDKEGMPEFSVTVFEKGFEQLIFKSTTCKGAWLNILEPLEKMRRDNDLVKNFPSYLSGEDLFGLTEPSILKLIESLPGIELLSGYNFKYGRTPLYKLPLAVNPSGCARTEPKLRTHFKRPQTLHSGSSSRSLPTTVSLVRSGDNSSPYLKQFVHSKTQQYRRLKNEWRTNVYLRRSNIQGLGLFAARELEKHTMVIEYIGELIRTEVSENREKIYNKNNRGVYMFRINETNYVVDATMCGGPARYINHSCNPNCVAELVPFEKEKDHKIIIITKRKIAQGEELCYDYKFDVEDDQHKIPCLCGAPNCRKWMN